MVDAVERVELEQKEGDNSYISVVQTVKLIPVTFSGNPKEFIEGVEAAHEIVHPRKHALLLKFVESEVAGEAKDKLSARGDRPTLENVKAT